MQPLYFTKKAIILIAKLYRAGISFIFKLSHIRVILIL